MVTIYMILMTVIALFFVFDSIVLRSEITELNEELDDKREEISQLEEKLRVQYNNYQTVAYKRRKLENILINFEEGTGYKFEEFMEEELSKKEFSKIKTKKDELHLMSGTKKQMNTTKKDIK